MEMINAIEISPFDFTNKEYEYPNGSSKDLPDEWDNFWRKCLTDRNLENLNAIKKGSYLVDIETIKNKELEEIIKKELEEIDLADYEEQISRISGGIVIKIENQFIIEPSCCGDLGNIQEWQSIFENESNNWQQLWIGHPWIFYRRVNDKIEFSDYYEANFEDIKEVKSIFEISSKELKEKLELINIQQIEFENKIQKKLEKMEIQNSKQIAKLMTGND